MQELNGLRVSKWVKQLCHLSSTPVCVVNAYFEPILQCVSRYTATRLVCYMCRSSFFPEVCCLTLTIKNLIERLQSLTRRLQIHNACLSFVCVHQMTSPLTEVGEIPLQLTTHLSTPKGWKAELAWLVDLYRTVYPHKWSSNQWRHRRNMKRSLHKPTVCRGGGVGFHRHLSVCFFGRYLSLKSWCS